MAQSSGGIHIKPENKGKLHASLGVPADHRIPMSALMKAKKSKNPTTARRANFAMVARKWSHG